ncbi:EpsG family protein [Leucobacter sp. USHLN153]|uniref:EpsG family protein n=1 Tax=Leucobacter sp. USHLN153 TaxID=3081268 RepID=UPI003017CD78
MAPYALLLLIVAFLVALALLRRTSGSPAVASRTTAPAANVRGIRAARTLFDLLIVGILCLFSGARWFVGTDYLLYSLVFEQVDARDWSATFASSPHEAGFTILSLLVKTATDNPAWLFATVSALTIAITYAAIRLLSENATVSLLVFVLFAQYFFAFNAVRQGLAIAIVFLAVGLWRRSHRVLTALAAVLAGLMHSSAFVALAIAVAFLLLRRRPLTLRAYALGILPVSFAARFAMSMPLVSDLASRINPRYAEYIAASTSAGLGSYLVLTVHAVLVAVSIAALRDAPQYAWLVKVYALAVPFMVIGTAAVELSRMANFFSWALILLVPALLHAPKLRWRRVAVLTMCFGYLYCLVYLLNYGGLIPYADVFGLFDRSDVRIHVPG